MYVSSSRTQPGPLRRTFLIHGVQLPVSYSSPVLFVWSLVGFAIRLGYLRYHCAGFAIIQLALLSLGWLCYHSAGFAIIWLASLSLGWLRYHSAEFVITVGFPITRLAPLSLSWLRYHSIGFTTTRLASLSFGWHRYRKIFGDTKFCYIIAFCEMNRIFVTALFPRLDTLSNLNNSP